MRNEPSVFAKTIQTANLWLKEMGEDLGPDRQRCYQALMAVLHALRDRLTLDESAHFSAQLPMIVRGMYFHSWDPQGSGRKRSLKAFLEDVEKSLENTAPINPKDACHAVFRVLDHYMTPEELQKLRKTLPKSIRDFWAATPQPRGGKRKTGAADERRPAGQAAGYDRRDYYDDDVDLYPGRYAARPLAREYERDARYGGRGSDSYYDGMHRYGREPGERDMRDRRYDREEEDYPRRDGRH